MIVFKNNQGKIYKKIVLCGDGGVGRTTLAQFYTQQPHKFNPNTRMTVGIQFFSKSFSLKNVELIFVFFDLAGQERWRFFQKYLIKKAHGAIFTFDLTRSPSLENTSQWVEICRAENPELPILMIGTKVDLVDEVQITDDYALLWKEEKSFFDYIRVSNKTGENVQVACHSIFQKVMENELLNKEDDIQWKHALVEENKKFIQLVERNKVKLRESVISPRVVEVTPHKQKEVDRRQSINLRKEVQRMLKVAHRIKLDMMQNALQLNKREFDRMIFKWAEEFGFIIDGDYLIIQKEEVSDFIEKMEKAFSEWEKQGVKKK